MRAIIQRVDKASVTVDNELISSISTGVLILLGVEDSDDEKDIEWLGNKIINLRIFDDANGVMNLSAKDIDGEIMVVSQFTLMASTKKGNRPSYLRASKPEISQPRYEQFCNYLGKETNKEIKTGVFGAHMLIDFVNNGPVSIIIDSKQRE